MKKLTLTLRWALGLAFMLALLIKPDVLFSAGGVTFAMANFITTSVSWAGKESFNHFFKPMFIGKAPWETQGVRVIPNVQSTMKLNYFGIARKLLKAYVKGFSAATGTTYTQRELSVVRMKAEASEDSNDFYQTVYEQVLNQGEWDDLSGTMLMDIIMNVWTKALESDYYRIFWLSDTNKETVTSVTQSGTADTDYNALQGMWSRIFDNASATPTADQIYRYAVTDGAVAQVQTVTMSTDAAGTGNLAIDGVDYLITRDTNATTTFTAFKAANATAISARGYTMSGTSTLIVTANIPGQPAAAITFTSVSGTTAYTIAATTANIAPVALAAGEAETILNDLYKNADKVLREVPKANKVFLVEDDVYENYIEYNESLGTERSHTMLLDGVEFTTYRGVIVMPMGWGVHLDADFPHATGELYAYPHRVIYTETTNLVLGLDAMSEYNQTRIWYNEDEQENRFRNQIKMGTQYVHPKLMAVAY